MKPKLRISLTQDGEFMKGQISLPEDGTFVLEAFALVIETMAKAYGLSVQTVASDIYLYAMKGVQDELSGVQETPSDNHTH